MSIKDKFWNYGTDITFDGAMSLIASGNSDQICRGLSQISALYCNGSLPFGATLMERVCALPDKQQKIVAGGTILGFRLNREFPGTLENWAIQKLPDFNARSIRAVVERTGFCRPPISLEH